MNAYLVQSAGALRGLDDLLPKLRRVVQAVHTVPDLGALRARLAERGGRSVAILSEAADHGAPRLEEVIQAAAAERGCFFIYVAGEISALDYRRLLGTRNAEWVPVGDAGAELLAAVEGWARRDGADAGPVRPCTVIAFLPSAGGVGNTTLAIESAVRIAAGRKTRVCVVDLNLQNGNICDLIDIEPHFDPRELAGSPDRLDAQMLDIFASKSPLGVDVYAVPRFTVGVEEVDPSAVYSLFNALNERYDVVIVDFPRDLPKWSEDILRNSDRVVVTCTYSVTSALRLASLLQRMRDAGLYGEHVHIAVSRYPRGLFGRNLGRADFEKPLKGERLHYVTGDEFFALDCSNVGRSMIASGRGRRICKDIRRLADALSADPAAARPRRGPLRRKAR